MGVLAIILGVFGIIFAWFPVIQYVALALSIAGIVFAIVGMKKSDTTNKGKGSSIAGLVCCIIATVLSGIGVFICTAATAKAIKETPSALESLEKTADSLKDLEKSANDLQKAAEDLKKLGN